MAIDKRRVLFIGGIPSSMTEEVIRDHFNKYDTIVNVRIMKDRKTKGSKGYAFVTVTDHQKIADILAEPQVIAGRTVDVQVASRRGEKEKWKEEQKKRKLFVSNIPAHIDNDALLDFFQKFGDVRNAFVIRDFATKASLGYGYVEFVELNILEAEFSSEDLMLDGAELICMPYQGKPQERKQLSYANKASKNQAEMDDAQYKDHFHSEEDKHTEKMSKTNKISQKVSTPKEHPTDKRFNLPAFKTKSQAIGVSEQLNEEETNYGFRVNFKTANRFLMSYHRTFMSSYGTYSVPETSVNVNLFSIPCWSLQPSNLNPALLNPSGQPYSMTQKRNVSDATATSPSNCISPSSFKLF